MFLPDQNRFQTELRNMIKKMMDENHDNHLGLLAGLKGPALEAARLSGYTVLNADDHQLPAGAGQGMKKVIYFSVAADNVMVRRHLGAGGTAVFIREGQVLAATGGRARLIATLDRNDGFPPEQLSLEDALAAAAGFLALGIHPGELWRETVPGDTVKLENIVDLWC